MNKLRWGILGAARIARKNWKAIRHSGNSVVTGVASRDRDRARSFVEECQRFEPFERTPEVFDNYEKLILSPNVDAVYIPLPTALRRDWVIRAAKAGKHVLSEKPCGVSVTELEDMLAACRKYRVQFMDGVMFMHNRRLEQLRQVLDDHTSVGPLQRITAHFSFLGAEGFFKENIRADGALEPLGCLGDLGWYGIRLALWAMKWEMPVEVSGRILSQAADSLSGIPVPTAFSGELVFAHGVSADFHCSFLAEHHQWANLTGTKGYVRVPDFVLPFSGSGLAFEVNQIKSSIEGCDWRLEHGVRAFAFAESGGNPATTQEANMFRNFSKQVLSRHLNEDWPRAALLTQKVVIACQEAASSGRSVQIRREFEPSLALAVLMDMKPIALTLAALLIGGLALQAEPELKGTAVELTQYLNGMPRTVGLVGDGEVKVPADRASISVKVVTENKSLQEASRVNQELRAKLARVLAERGIPAGRIQASKFSSTPKYGMFGEKAKSYRVVNTVKITAQDEQEFQAVGGLVDATPEFRYDSIEFEHSDKDGLKKQALAQAIDKATEKKQMFEEKLNVKLTPRSFDELSVGGVPTIAGRGYAKVGDSISYSSRSSMPGKAAAATDEGEENLPTSFGELVFKAHVTVEYAVEAK